MKILYNIRKFTGEVFILKHYRHREKSVDPNKRYYYYNEDLSLPFYHGTLIVKERVDDRETEKYIDDRRRKYTHYIKAEKQYRCVCKLCGCEYYFTEGELSIYLKNNDGYTSKACCEYCKKPSSFEWSVEEILRRNKVIYSREMKVNGLVGEDNSTPLRFDFMVWNTREDCKPKAIIECNGRQHYEPSDEYGGKYGFYKQQNNDKKKREWAIKQNIPMIEIPYNKRSVEQRENFLRKNGIIC